MNNAKRLQADQEAIGYLAPDAYRNTADNPMPVGERVQWVIVALSLAGIIQGFLR